MVLSRRDIAFGAILVLYTCHNSDSKKRLLKVKGKVSHSLLAVGAVGAGGYFAILIMITDMILSYIIIFFFFFFFLVKKYGSLNRKTIKCLRISEHLSIFIHLHKQ